MMLVKNYMDRSPIHGQGVFAAEWIAKGTRVWEVTPGFDLLMPKATLQLLPDIQRDFMAHFGYVECATGQLVLCMDHARFMNFSARPNVARPTDWHGDPLDLQLALRDIEPGEELLFAVTEDLDAELKIGSQLYRT
ncbi:MAG: Nuclear protein SET, partial [Halothiobacillaceae bacterium]